MLLTSTYEALLLFGALSRAPDTSSNSRGMSELEATLVLRVVIGHSS